MALRRGRLSSTFGKVLLVLLVAVTAAEVYFAFRERHPAHMLDGRVVNVFPHDDEEAVLSLRKQFVSAYPFVAPQQFLFRPYKSSPPALIPLAGISHATTELCNEDGRDVIYKSDRYGFNNPDDVWTNPDVALIGDSFVQGICVRAPDQLGSLIRQATPTTLNLGVVGAGPLSKLAVLREYGASVRPQTVLWFFYEGYDIEDLVRERASPLKQYLDPTYSQDLMSRQPQIDSALSRFADSVLAGDQVMTPGLRDVPQMLTLPRLRHAIERVVAKAPDRISLDVFATLDTVLAVAKSEVDKWNGKLYFVYLPDYQRFDGHNNAEIQNAALGAAERAGIPVINVAKAFAADRDPRRYWPKPTSHYGPNGNALVAQTILSAIAPP